MTTRDDKSAIFPTDWGWGKYEPTFRRWTYKGAMLERAEGQLGKGERDARLIAIANWADDKVQAGKLPAWNDMYSKGDEFGRYFLALMGTPQDQGPGRQSGALGRLRIGPECPSTDCPGDAGATLIAYS